MRLMCRTSCLFTATRREKSRSMWAPSRNASVDMYNDPLGIEETAPKSCGPVLVIATASARIPVACFDGVEGNPRCSSLEELAGKDDVPDTHT